MSPFPAPAASNAAYPAQALCSPSRVEADGLAIPRVQPDVPIEDQGELIRVRVELELALDDAESKWGVSLTWVRVRLNHLSVQSAATAGMSMIVE